jgi:hypothetical protein
MGVVRIETSLAEALKGAAGKLVDVPDFVTTLKWAQTNWIFGTTQFTCPREGSQQVTERRH